MTGEPGFRVRRCAGNPLMGNVLRYSSGKPEAAWSSRTAESAER